MEFKSIYSENAVRDLYDKIMHQRKLGTIKHFEIFIDNMSVIPRTNDISNFFKYKSQLKANSRTVVVKLYKGESRVNDYYLFETTYLLNQKKQEADAAIIKKAIEKQEEILLLRTKIKRLKTKKSKLKTRNQVLESELKKLRENKNAFELVGKLAQGFTAESPSIEHQVNGVAINEQEKIAGIDKSLLLNIYTDLKDKLSEAEFQAILGIVVTLGEQTEIIKPTQEFVSSKFVSNL